MTQSKEKHKSLGKRQTQKQMLHFDKEGNANSVRPRLHQQYFATGKCTAENCKKCLFHRLLEVKYPLPRAHFSNFCSELRQLLQRTSPTSAENFVNFFGDVFRLPKSSPLIQARTKVLRSKNGISRH